MTTARYDAALTEMPGVERRDLTATTPAAAGLRHAVIPGGRTVCDRRPIVLLPGDFSTSDRWTCDECTAAVDAA